MTIGRRKKNEAVVKPSVPGPTFGSIYNMFVAASEGDGRLSEAAVARRRKSGQTLAGVRIWGESVIEFDYEALVASARELEKSVGRKHGDRLLGRLRLACKWAWESGAIPQAAAWKLEAAFVFARAALRRREGGSQ